MRKVFADNAGGTRAWLALARTTPMILVAPNGTHPETHDTYGDRQHWYDLRSKETSPKDTVLDDVAFIQGMLQYLKTKTPYDPQRVYVTGSSNGGMMTQRLLIELLGVFKAGAAFLSALPESDQSLPLPETIRPVPLLLLNGTADTLIRWEGGTVAEGMSPFSQGKTRSVTETIR
ncbi:MAG: alpha/beta hydrolase family esterase [Vampirovibrionales bacterium]